MVIFIIVVVGIVIVILTVIVIIIVMVVIIVIVVIIIIIIVVVISIAIIIIIIIIIDFIIFHSFDEYMEIISALPLHPKNKLLIYQRYVLSKVSWDLTVTNISITETCEVNRRLLPST